MISQVFAVKFCWPTIRHDELSFWLNPKMSARNLPGKPLLDQAAVPTAGEESTSEPLCASPLLPGTALPTNVTRRLNVSVVLLAPSPPPISLKLSSLLWLLIWLNYLQNIQRKCWMLWGLFLFLLLFLFPSEWVGLFPHQWSGEGSLLPQLGGAGRGEIMPWGGSTGTPQLPSEFTSYHCHPGRKRVSFWRSESRVFFLEIAQVN